MPFLKLFPRGFSTVEIHRVDQLILDWTTAVAGKVDWCQLSVSFNEDSLVTSMNFYGKGIEDH